MPGGTELKNEVLSNSTCALCGACLDWCPYIANLEDHLVMRFDCNITEGRCYSVCPRTFADWQTITKKYLPDAPVNVEIGPYFTAYKVKAAQAVDGQQNGGTVSRLVKTVMEEKLAQIVLLTGSDDRITPQPFLSAEINDIQNAAGSRFLASPGMRKIIEAQQNKNSQLAAVGRPCQIQALRKLDFNRPPQQPPLEMLTIGLFCMWSLGWDFKDYLQQQFPGEEILGIAIPRHGFEVTTNQGTYDIPFDEVKKFIRPGCSYCMDMTAELADISVGAFEPEKGWNTVIIRTQKGQDLFARACSKGYLVCEAYPQAELQRLKGASLNKKKRGLDASQTIFERGVKPFIDINSEFYQQIRELAEGVVK